MTDKQIEEFFTKSAEVTKDKDLFAQRLAPRYAILDKLTEDADALKNKQDQSDAYKEGVHLVLQMIADKRRLYEQANSVMRLQLIAPSDHNDVDSFVKAIGGMMEAIKGLGK